MNFEDQSESEEQEESAHQELKEPHVYSVSELNAAIRSQLEGQFNLIWLRGEISNFKAHSSGHFYFSLKDKRCQINAVMFRGFNARLNFRLEDGLEVLVRGKVTVYEPRGNYQIFCELIEPVGAGALQIAFEQLKNKLQSEGLFDASRKRPLPVLPRHVAIVTSPTGAAIRDMLNVLGRRFKGLKITVVPALVQGDQAPASLVKAIELAQKLEDIDVMIVGRGGGSMEDLWAFNSESVARAIAACRVPVISAVGHEVDFTIADFVADLRAPTPSAAAELVVKNAADLIDKLCLQKARLCKAMQVILQGLKRHCEHIEKRLVDPQRRLQDLSIRCDELSQRLQAAAFRYLQMARTDVDLKHRRLKSPAEILARLEQRSKVLTVRLQSVAQKKIETKKAEWVRASALLESLSPLKVIERGYSITTTGGTIVKSVEQLKTGDDIEVRLAKGRLLAEVKKLFES